MTGSAILLLEVEGLMRIKFSLIEDIISRLVLEYENSDPVREQAPTDQSSRDIIIVLFICYCTGGICKTNSLPLPKPCPKFKAEISIKPSHEYRIRRR
jgi:hypothetical protein